MQLDFLFDPGPKKQLSKEVLQVGDQSLPLNFVRNPRARRYVLRLSRRGDVRVTIPRGGSQKEALKLAHENVSWLEGQWEKQQKTQRGDRSWGHGTEFLFHGEPVQLGAIEKDLIRVVQFADEEFAIDAVDDIKAAVERHLWSLAKKELPPRTAELAAEHGFTYARLTVRNQRTRWGSCSPSGTISLNWRLIQLSPAASDYIILHELAHTKFMNHSAKFWREVKRVCPNYRDAELWMKKNGDKILSPV